MMQRTGSIYAGLTWHHTFISNEDNLLPISALQHLLFCPRQCVLIHIEQAWVENRLTAEGRIGHEKVDKGGAESRLGRKTVFGLPLRSIRLGLVGKADVVEFERDDDGNWIPFPVEHKHGRPKQKDCDLSITAIGQVCTLNQVRERFGGRFCWRPKTMPVSVRLTLQNPIR